MKHLIFDIETVPDYDGIRALEPTCVGSNEAETLEFFWQIRYPDDDKASLRKRFLPPHLQRIITIGLALADFDHQSFLLWSLAPENVSKTDQNAKSDEKHLLQRFFEGISKHTPQLVSWNGSQFDLPVLQQRAMIHGVTSRAYWDIGDYRQDFRYNNYLNRYQYRHLDLMDVLASYNGRNFAKLDDLAILCGFPGKQGLGGSKIANAFSEGRLDEICQYCEADVLNTYWLYLRFLLIAGRLSSSQYQKAFDTTIQWLEKQTDPFWHTFYASLPSQPHFESSSQYNDV